MDEEELGEKVKPAVYAISEQMALVKKTAQVIKNQQDFDEKTRQMLLHQSESIRFTRSGKRIDAYGNIESQGRKLVGRTRSEGISDCKKKIRDIVEQVEDGKISKDRGVERVFSRVEDHGGSKEKYEAYIDELKKGTVTRRGEIYDAVTDALAKIEALPETASQETPKIIKQLQAAQQNQPDALYNELCDAGQVSRGKNTLYKTPQEFFIWCVENNYIDIVTPAYIYEKIKTNCNLDSLKKYYRRAKNR